MIPSEDSCELWGSAPAILPLRPSCGYNPYIFYDNATATFEEWAGDTMKEWGMFVQIDLLSGSEVTQLRQAVIDEIAKAESLLRMHRPEINIGKDIISFKEIASRGNYRFDLLIAPTSTVNQFVHDVIYPRIHQVLERIIGAIEVEIDCDISVVYSKPGAPNQGWHADGDHPKGATDAGWDVDGWKTALSDPYALCLFIPLIDLNDDTGYTQFWPASHRNKGLAGFGPFAEIAQATWDGICKAGSSIWYDYRLMHRGLRNQSSLLRPVLQLLFKRKWYEEKRNYGTESIVTLSEEQAENS
jgi:ectoine hydroxylase-related dioxygenase (phytanoyl-CoA dioxygenase family)